MPPGEEIAKIEQVEKTGKSKGVEPTTELEGVERTAPNKEKFDQLVKQPEPSTQTQQVAKTDKPTSTDATAATQPVERVSRPTQTEIVKKTDSIVHRMDEIKSTLETPNVKINPAHQGILQSKLSHINDSIKIALSKVGVEGTPPPTMLPGGGAVERFLGMLTHSQSQLSQLSSTMQSDVGGAFSPAQLLAVQIKVNHMQQEVEFFTSALSKALEGIKTIMNVQV